VQHLESSAGIDFEGVAQVTCGAPGRLGDTVQVAVFALYEGSFGSRALAVVRGKVEPHGYVAIGRDLVDGPKGRSDAAEHGDVEVSIVGLDEGVGIVTVDQKGASGGWGKIMERRKDARCGDAKEEAAADLELMNKAQELDPSSSVTLADKGVMLFNAGRTREGIDLLMEVERSDPGFRSPHYYMMLIRLYLRDYPAYLTEGQKAAEISHDAVLRDTITEAQKGYARDGARGLLDNLYTSQKKYYAAGKLSAATLAKTCVMLGKKHYSFWKSRTRGTIPIFSSAWCTGTY
jgi:tetratricopeptide (TPR) repeat protein